MNKYNLDTHKLQYHYNEICEFFSNGKLKAPIYVEISPAGVCNHHCVFCNFNYLGHKGRFDDNKMLELIKELKEIGVKSIVFAGIGEPLLHKDTIKAITLASKLGIDVGLSTNGALIKDIDLKYLAKHLKWIRFSFNGATPKEYAKIHKTNLQEYDKIKKNIKKLVDVKNSLNLHFLLV